MRPSKNVNSCLHDINCYLGCSGSMVYGTGGTSTDKLTVPPGGAVPHFQHICYIVELYSGHVTHCVPPSGFYACPY